MKNSEKLLEAIGDVRGDLVPAPDRAYPRSSRIYTLVGSICAALLIAGGGVLLYRSRGDKPAVKPESSVQQTDTTAGTSATQQSSQTTQTVTETQPPVDQPKEVVPLWQGMPDAADAEPKTGTGKISAARIDSGGAGLSGNIAVNSTDELDSAIPWEAAAEAGLLPVYRCLGTNGSLLPVYLTEEQMTDIAARAATALSVQVQTKQVNRIGDLIGDRSDERAYQVVLKCGDVTLEAAGDGELDVTFRNGVPIPAEYALPAEPTADQEQAYLMWCAEQFADLLQMKAPAGYSVHTRKDSGRLDAYYYLYDKADSPAQTLLNSTVRNVRIAAEYGSVKRLFIHNPLTAAEYCGEYPIITQDEAKQRLTAQEQVDEAEIAAVSLVYWYNVHQQSILPYYRFSVKADDNELLADGLTGYAYCYVPAVREEFLEAEPAHPVQ